MADLKFTMTAERACDAARSLLYNFRTRYNNKFPYNCAYTGYDGSDYYISGDCWNMFPKCLYWGEALEEPVDYYYQSGHYVSPSLGYAKTGLPDTTGDNIIKSYCSHVSDDFSFLKPGELLLIPGVHMGLYVGEYGEWTYEGKYYNVIEFTSDSVLGSGCRPSYVDSQGRRWSIDGKQSGYWSVHGQFNGFTYEEAEQTDFLPETRQLLKAIANYQILPVISKGNDFYWINIWIQYALMAAGYYKGGIDGDFGAYTEEACKSFQAANSLPETGSFTNKDLAVLLQTYYFKED